MLLITGLAYGGEVNMMPKELVQFAHANGCDQVSNFYEADTGAIHPPFVYGYLPGDEQNSAVFWCRQKVKNKEYKYMLLLLLKSQHELAKCSNKVEWPSTFYYPGGLSVYKNNKDTLDDFFYLDDVKRKVPKGLYLKHPAILSMMPGLEETFYCHNGKWLVRMRD